MTITKAIDILLMARQEKGGQQRLNPRPLFLSTLQQWSLLYLACICFGEIVSVEFENTQLLAALVCSGLLTIIMALTAYSM